MSNSEEPKSKSRWALIPGYLKAIAAAIVAVVTIMTALWGTGILDSNGPVKYNLTYYVQPAGSGAVDLNPQAAEGRFDDGTQVTLTATANEGYTFDYWSGDASGTVSSITVAMNSDMNVVAHFKVEEKKFTLDYSIYPAGSGAVDLNPQAAEGRFDDGTQVTLTATANEGYTFDYWSGDAGGTDSSTTINMNSDKLVIAYFTSLKASVSVTPDSASITEGDTEVLVATVKDALGNVVTDPTVTWSSDNPSVATVSASGVVTGISEGTATITAEWKGEVGSATVTVTMPHYPPAFEPSPNQFNPKIGPAGQQVTLFGDNFDGPNLRVTFGGYDALIVSATATQVVVEVPSGLSGATKISVETDYGLAISDDEFTIF